MARPTQVVRYTVVGVSLVYALLLYLAGFSWDAWSSRLVALLPAIASVCLIVWDTWVWRMPGSRRFVHRPRIDGLWRVWLEPTAESHIPAGGDRGPIEAYFVVKQTYWLVSVRQLSKESASISRAVFWELRASTDIERLNILYENEPRQSLQKRSPRHLGACTLEMMSRAPAEIRGSYFTDRYTRGDLRAELVDRSGGHASFDAAKLHADNTGRTMGASP